MTNQAQDKPREECSRHAGQWQDDCAYCWKTKDKPTPPDDVETFLLEVESLDDDDLDNSYTDSERFGCDSWEDSLDLGDVVEKHVTRAVDDLLDAQAIALETGRIRCGE